MNLKAKQLLLATTAALTPLWAAASWGQSLPEGWIGTGNAGLAFPNGVVTQPQEGTAGQPHYYVSTHQGLSGVGSLPGVGGSGSPTNGSLLQQPTFNARAGDEIIFQFNYVTSDGSGFADYSWARLVDANTSEQVDVLFTARTTPSGTTAPGFSMPEPVATLNPASAPIISNQTTWDQLGPSSGSCYAPGCGFTDWVTARYTIPRDGEFRMEFGVTNWNDTAFQSGMAINELTPNISPIPGAKDSGEPPTIKIFDAQAIQSYRDTGVYNISEVQSRFDPSLPTVLVTHGWQMDKDQKDFPIAQSETSFTSRMVSGLNDRLNEIIDVTGSAFASAITTNVLGITWEQAHRFFPRSVANQAPNAGREFARIFADMVGGESGGPIHLIGHSMGSYFNLNAFEALYGNHSIQVAHMTSLDAPMNRNARLLGQGVPISQYIAVAKNDDYAAAYLDNFWGTDISGGFGWFIDGWGPYNMFGNATGGLAMPRNHTGVWRDYYLNTIESADARGGFNDSFLVDNIKPEMRLTLTQFGETNEEIVRAMLTPNALIGSTYDSDTSLLTMQTQSNAYALFDIFIPDKAEFLFFDLIFDKAGESDWLEVVLNDELLGTFHANLYLGSGATIYLDFFGEVMGNAELYFLLVDASSTGSSLTASNFNFITSGYTTMAPIPLPATAWMLITSIALWVGVGIRRRRLS